MSALPMVGDQQLIECRPYRCKMLASACVARQARARELGQQLAVSVGMGLCVDCTDGARVAREGGLSVAAPELCEREGCARPRQDGFSFCAPHRRALAGHGHARTKVRAPEVEAPEPAPAPAPAPEVAPAPEPLPTVRRAAAPPKPKARARRAAPSGELAGSAFDQALEAVALVTIIGWPLARQLARRMTGRAGDAG